MFDIGWSELLVIGVVALVVIGPKDLPRALRAVGFWVRKARTVSREFQSSIEQMMREAELDEVRRQVEKAASVDLDKEFQKTIDPSGSLNEALKPPSLDEPAKPAPAETPAAPAEPSPPLPSAETPAEAAPAALPDAATPQPALPEPEQRPETKSGSV